MKTKNEYKKKVEAGQDIFDLCIQEYGGLNALFLLLADNPELDLIRKLVPGEEIKFRVEVPQNVPLNKNQMDNYRTKDIRVNMKEVELLRDPVDNPVITTSTGVSLVTSQTGLPISANSADSVPPPPPDPVVMTGVLTSQGDVLVASQGGIIRPETAPNLGTEKGINLMTSQGDLLVIS